VAAHLTQFSLFIYFSSGKTIIFFYFGCIVLFASEQIFMPSHHKLEGSEEVNPSTEKSRTVNVIDRKSENQPPPNKNPTPFGFLHPSCTRKINYSRLDILKIAR